MNVRDSDEEAESTGAAGIDSVPTVLTTRRLVLRRPSPADAQAIAEIANNAKVARWLSRMPHPYDESDARSWIGSVSGEDAGECAFVITRVDAGKETVLGACGVDRDKDFDLAQIGYWVGEPYWGQGIATEAVQGLIDHVFTTSVLDAVGASCRVTNVASRRVIEKCGFQYCGLDMAQSRFDNAVVPVFAFRLTRRIWESLKSWAAA